MHIHVDVSHSAVSPFRKLACNLKATHTLFWRLLNIPSFCRDCLRGQQAEKPITFGTIFPVNRQDMPGFVDSSQKGAWERTSPRGKPRHPPKLKLAGNLLHFRHHPSCLNTSHSHLTLSAFYLFLFNHEKLSEKENNICKR